MVVDILRLHWEGESASFGFLHTQLLAAKDNIKGCRAQHINWLTSWLGPEWIVTSVAHVRFRVFYPSACVQTLRWLRLVGPTRICRHRWLQVAGCFPWLELTCVPGARGMFFSNGYSWSESSCVPGRRQALSSTVSSPLCPGFLPEEEGIPSVAAPSIEEMEEVVAELLNPNAFDNAIFWNSLNFLSFCSFDIPSHFSAGIISHWHLGRIL